LDSYKPFTIALVGTYRHALCCAVCGLLGNNRTKASVDHPMRSDVGRRLVDATKQHPEKITIGASEGK
jgi:hypothetical protein